MSSPAPPPYKLFDSNSVALATFLGTPIAGGILMAVDYHRLGRQANAVSAILGATALTAAAVELAIFMPQALSAILSVVFMVLMKSAAKFFQGPAVDEHVQHGGALGSNWSATGLGLLFLALVLGSYFLYDHTFNPKVTIGKDEVFYSGSATKNEATDLGQSLKSMGYFTGRGVSVFLSKRNNGPELSFIVNNDWDHPATIDAFIDIARRLAPSLGGFPIRLRLISPAKAPLKEWSIGLYKAGKDEVYYIGGATAADAKALGDALIKQQYFQNSGVSVFESKGPGTTLSFIIKAGFGHDPQSVATFETMVRQMAPSIGGLPIKLRLQTRNLDVEKELTVQ